MAVRQPFATENVVRQRRELIAGERCLAADEEEVGHVPLRIVVVEVRNASLERLLTGAAQRVTMNFEREEAVDIVHLRTLWEPVVRDRHSPEMGAAAPYP